jgi:hypothetical protein
MQDDLKPVAWMYEMQGNLVRCYPAKRGGLTAIGYKEIPLYAHPPAEALSRQQAEIERLRAAEQSAYARGYAAAREDAAGVADEAAAEAERWRSPSRWHAKSVATAIRALVPGDSGAGEG